MEKQADTLRVAFFKGSRQPLIDALTSHDVPFKEQFPLPGVVYASGSYLEIGRDVVVALAPALAAFLGSRPSRRVVITTDKSSMTFDAQGYNVAEASALLKEARSATAIETKPESNSWRD